MRYRCAASGSVTLLPNTFKSPRFNPTRDFSPVAQIAQIDFVLTVSPGVPAKTVAEFAAAEPCLTLESKTPNPGRRCTLSR